MWDYIGYLAGFITTICYIPQIAKIIRTRKVHDISFSANLILLLGLSLWAAFGMGTGNWPVIIANCVSVCFVISLLVMKKVWN